MKGVTATVKQVITHLEPRLSWTHGKDEGVVSLVTGGYGRRCYRHSAWPHRDRRLNLRASGKIDLISLWTELGERRIGIILYKIAFDHMKALRICLDAQHVSLCYHSS